LDRIDAAAPVPNLVLALARLKAGDLKAADAQAQKLPLEGIHRFVTPLVHAWIEAGLGRTDEAIAALAPVREVKGFAPLAEFHAGLIDDFAGRSEAAAAAFQEVMKSGQHGNWRTIEALGSLYERTGQPQKARALYEGFAANAS